MVEYAVDAAFANPEIYEFLEADGIGYISSQNSELDPVSVG